MRLQHLHRTTSAESDRGHKLDMRLDKSVLRKNGSSAIPEKRRYLIYLIAILTLTTGAVWLIFHYFVRSVDQFGFENPHPFQRPWLVAHAWAGLCAVWMFGVLWPSHIKKAWRRGLRLVTGSTVFLMILILIVTGYALYYIGDDKFRETISLLHWIIGIIAAVQFWIHSRNTRN
jgi:Ni,Fe-hydrogenase I cytochrome b subunit